MVEQSKRVPGLLGSIPNVVRDVTPCFGLSPKTGFGLRFAGHDLTTASLIVVLVAVMHAGRIVDAGYTNDAFAPPHHPVNSVPALRQGRFEEVITSRDAEAGMRSNVRLHDRPCPFRMPCPLVISGTCDLETGHGYIITCGRDDEATVLAAQGGAWSLPVERRPRCGIAVERHGGSDRMGHPEHGLLVEGIADDLNAGGNPVGVETRGD